MVTINGKEVKDFLVDGINNPLPDWFKPFNHPYVIGSKEFVVFDAQFVPAGKASNWPQNVIPLAYVPHNINCVPMGNGNCVVISSQFCGCLMAAFTYRGGDLALNKDQRYVCHIAIEDRKRGDECETAFLEAIRNGKINDVIRFYPDLIVPIDNWGTFAGRAYELGYTVDFMKDVHGLISSDNECFSFIVGRKSDTNESHVLSIVKWTNEETIEWGCSINPELGELLKK